jgi:hypothetical protein
MTRKSKRELEREVSDLSDDEQAGEGILIVYEQDDGTCQDSDGEPVPESDLENANLVIHYGSEE